MLLFCLSVLYERGVCERRIGGDTFSAISSTATAVIEPNGRVMRVGRQDASHLWIGEHQHDVCSHRRVLLQIANICQGLFFFFNENQRLKAGPQLLFLAPPAFFPTIVHNPRARLTCLCCVSVQVTDRG